jgi:predicted DNA-binding protein
MDNPKQKTVKLLIDADIVAWLSIPPERIFGERVNKILRLVMELECRRQSAITEKDPSNLNDLELFWEELGDWEDLYLAEQSLEDIRTGRTKAIPLEDVMKGYI